MLVYVGEIAWESWICMPTCIPCQDYYCEDCTSCNVVRVHIEVGPRLLLLREFTYLANNKTMP